jgi:hypothetical protein
MTIGFLRALARSGSDAVMTHHCQDVNMTRLTLGLVLISQSYINRIRFRE